MSIGLAYLCEVASSPLSLFTQCQMLQLESVLRMVCVIWESLLTLSFECQGEQANTDMYFVLCLLQNYTIHVRN